MNSWVTDNGGWIDLPAVETFRTLAQLPGRGAVGELTLDHVGLAVRNVEDAVGRFSKWLGVHTWTVSTIGVPVEFRCAEQLAGARIALAQMGPIAIELVQPTEGGWTPADFLETRGEGVYHLGFRVPDVGAAVRAAEAGGLKVATIGTHENEQCFAYTEPDGLCGLGLEFVGPRFPTSAVKAVETVE
jgi:catechol 2,3-dioxygenase-like lactoylglutathione lyase family enzyme